MTQVAWVIALIVVVSLLQLAVYRYLGGREGAQSLEASSTDGPPGALPGERSGAEGGAVEDGRRCPACGAVNDRSYEFCRNCVSRIGT